MTKIFYISISGVIIFEILKVYFIMPMPGSQNMNSLPFAYFLHSWRWFFRVLFSLGILYSIVSVYSHSRILPSLLLILAIGIAYLFNFKMSADKMFLTSTNLQMKPVCDNKIDENKQVLVLEYDGFAKCYPIQFLGYHHQVFDSIDHKPILITYCTVCRTGRVFEPIVDGKVEEFRLVGMDHFNAMFEDKTSGSWWRQVNGEAVAGKGKCSQK
jgi:hypothetical protein